MNSGGRRLSRRGWLSGALGVTAGMALGFEDEAPAAQGRPAERSGQSRLTQGMVRASQP